MIRHCAKNIGHMCTDMAKGVSDLIFFKNLIKTIKLVIKLTRKNPPLRDGDEEKERENDSQVKENS